MPLWADCEELAQTLDAGKTHGRLICDRAADIRFDRAVIAAHLWRPLLRRSMGASAVFSVVGKTIGNVEIPNGVHVLQTVVQSRWIDLRFPRIQS